MNRKTIVFISIFLTSSLILIGVALLPLANASTVEQFSVGRDGKVVTKSIQLQTRQTVKGAFNISGGSSTEMYFWVRDSTGVVIIDSGRVVDQANFEFTATEDGEYILNFENRGIHSRAISLEYDVFSPSIVDIPSQILGVDSRLFVGLIVTIGVVLVGIAFAVWRKRRN
jgi:hypothetical protein